MAVAPSTDTMSKTDSSQTNRRSSKDFNRPLVAMLNARGIYFYGSMWLPRATDDYANGERGYQLDDNGTHRVRTYAEVLEMGGAS